jgi:hypothetical protein
MLQERWQPAGEKRPVHRRVALSCEWAGGKPGAFAPGAM